MNEHTCSCKELDFCCWMPDFESAVFTSVSCMLLSHFFMCASLWGVVVCVCARRLSTTSCCPEFLCGCVGNALQVFAPGVSCYTCSTQYIYLYTSLDSCSMYLHTFSSSRACHFMRSVLMLEIVRPCACRSPVAPRLTFCRKAV